MVFRASVFLFFSGGAESQSTADHGIGSVFPQQRELMGSSAQISSGVCRCGLQEQVPEEGSGEFRRVPASAGVGSGGRFR